MPFPAGRWGTTVLHLKGELLLCGHKEKGKRQNCDGGATAAALSLHGCLEYITQSRERCDVAPISVAHLQ